MEENKCEKNGQVCTCEYSLVQKTGKCDPTCPGYKTAEATLNLHTSNGRNHWLNVVSSVLTAINLCMIQYVKYIVETGKYINNMEAFLIGFVNITMLIMAGLGALNCISLLVEEFNENCINSIGVVRLILSSLSFANGFANYRSVHQIVINAQREFLDSFKYNFSKEEKAAFDHIHHVTMGEDTMRGNSRVIQAVKHIKQPRQFFDDVNKLLDCSVRSNSLVTLTPDGLININEELLIHPRKFSQVSKESRDTLFDITKRIYDRTICVPTIKRNILEICQAERIHLEFHRRDIIRRLSESLNSDLNDFRVNNRAIFARLRPCDVDRLDKVMNFECRDYDPELINVILIICNRLKCADINDFCTFACFVHEYRVNLKDSMVNICRKYRTNISLEQIKSNPIHIEKIVDTFKCWRKKVGPINSTNFPRFKSANYATYQYYKYKEFDRGPLSVDDYFGAIEELFENDDFFLKSNISQDGMMEYLTYYDRGTGAKGVLMKSVTDKKKQFVSTMFYNKAVD